MYGGLVWALRGTFTHMSRCEWMDRRKTRREEGKR